MDYFDYSRDQYYREAERHRDISSYLSIPVGILTVLGGLMAAIASQLKWPFDGFEGIATAFLGLAALSMIVTCYFLIRTYIGHGYGYVATPKELLEHRARLIAFYAERSEPFDLVDEEVKQIILQQFADFADINSRNNDRKLGFLSLARLSLVATLLFTSVAWVPISIQNFIGADDIQRVELVKKS